MGCLVSKRDYNLTHGHAVKQVPGASRNEGREKKMAQVAIQVDGEITVGAVVRGVAKEGETVTVELHDENGMPITATGVVVEVLES